MSLPGSGNAMIGGVQEKSLTCARCEGKGRIWISEKKLGELILRDSGLYDEAWIHDTIEEWTREEHTIPCPECEGA